MNNSNKIDISVEAELDVGQRIDELRAIVEDIRRSLVTYQDHNFPKKTLLILIQHKTKLSLATITAVLDSLETLMENYLYDDA